MAYLIHVPMDMRAFTRWAGERGLMRCGVFDEGHALHILLTGMFGRAVLQPFRLFASDRRRSAGLYAYAELDAGALRRIADTVAPPDCLAALDPARIRTKHMPARFVAGQRLGFDLRVRPVRRRRRGARESPSGTVVIKGGEIDAYRGRRAEAAGGPSREQVYAGWLGVRCGAAVRVERCRLADFKETRAIRGDGLGPGGPDATLRGVLTVQDPDAFALLVRKGVGRHRAYGYGMVLLRPADGGPTAP